MATARERQLIKRRPDIAVEAPDALVVVASALIPQTIVVIQGGDTPGREEVGQLVQVIRSARSDPTRDKPRNTWACRSGFIRTEIPPPPGDVRDRADEQLAIAHETAIRKAKGLGARREGGGARTSVRTRNFLHAFRVSRFARYWIARCGSADVISQLRRRLTRGRDELGSLY